MTKNHPFINQVSIRVKFIREQEYSIKIEHTIIQEVRVKQVMTKQLRLEFNSIPFEELCMKFQLTFIQLVIIK